MSIKLKSAPVVIILLFFVFFKSIYAQDTTKSLAYKNNKEHRTMYFYQPNLAYELWQQFTLMKKANEGDPLAEHELGLRYLLGQGTVADTLKGAYWVKKAADAKLAAACFNYGILLLNGWGVKWDPFKAFNYFSIAAKDGMPAAQFVFGLFYTDNLIVRKDWATAYSWVKKAADQDYKPAIETLKEIKKKVPNVSSANDSNMDSAENDSNDKEDSFTSSIGLVFIDFDTETDTTRQIPEKVIIQDLNNEGNKELADTLGVSKSKDSTLLLDKKRIDVLNKFAENGSPEALTLLGKLNEKGTYFKKNIITAAAYYIRAVRLNSNTAPFLLYQAAKEKSFMNIIQSKVDKNDPEAMFVWYGLNDLGFSNLITHEDAVKLLKRSAQKKYVPAIVELGLNYYTGKVVKKDTAEAYKLWNEAEKLGSTEAKTRIVTSRIFDRTDEKNLQKDTEFLRVAAAEGSVLAQTALAKIYETGIGTDKNIAEAVKYYRFAAQRGNRYAYNQLLQIYNSVRPPGPEFRIN